MRSNLFVGIIKGLIADEWSQISLALILLCIVATPIWKALASERMLEQAMNRISLIALEVIAFLFLPTLPVLRLEMLATSSPFANDNHPYFQILLTVLDETINSEATSRMAPLGSCAWRLHPNKY
jgi:hypothetical protein